HWMLKESAQACVWSCLRGLCQRGDFALIRAANRDDFDAVNQLCGLDVRLADAASTQDTDAHDAPYLCPPRWRPPPAVHEIHRTGAAHQSSMMTQDRAVTAVT